MYSPKEHWESMTEEEQVEYEKLLNSTEIPLCGTMLLMIARMHEEEKREYLKERSTDSTYRNYFKDLFKYEKK